MPPANLYANRNGAKVNSNPQAGTIEDRPSDKARQEASFGRQPVKVFSDLSGKKAVRMRLKEVRKGLSGFVEILLFQLCVRLILLVPHADPEEPQFI
jgi:hypothetical protein